VTNTQAIMGSPVYMSPEQLVSAKQVDARADIWSLGVLMFEALAGRPPFEAESMPQIVTRILHSAAPRLIDARPDLPPEAGMVVGRCLEKDPAQRFGDVAELARALAPYSPEGARSTERIARVLGRVPKAGSQPPPPPVPALKPSGDAWGATQPHVPPAARSKAGPWIVGIILTVCGVVGVGALFALRARHVESFASPASIVVPVPSASVAEAAQVKLAPPESSPSFGPAPVSAPPPDPPAPAPRVHAGPPRPRPAPTPVAASAPVPAPAPTPTEPPDPLHMGIK
jgi:eukaryotic-like serine/threonine-protein kinase